MASNIPERLGITFHKRFVDGATGRQYGPGAEYQVRTKDALRLAQDGKGTLSLPEAQAYAAGQASAAAAKSAEAANLPPLPNPRLQGVTDGQEEAGQVTRQALPDDFPGVEHLREAGITSYEDLDALAEAGSAEETLLGLPGIGKGTLNKIAMALDARGE